TQPLGAEPETQRSRQHREWQRLHDRLGPTGTLAELAARLESGSDPAGRAAINAGMSRRRDRIVEDTARSERPPGWARPLLRRTTWSTNDKTAGRERATVGKIAVYRERFQVRADGLGPMPASPEQRRLWQALRAELAATVEHRTRTQAGSASSVEREP